MRSNVIFVGWDRPVRGREQPSAELFQEFMQYIAKLQQDGAIESFEAVILGDHGGDMNGFWLIQGEPDKLDALVSTDEWATFETRGGLYVEGFGVVRGVTGDLLLQSMDRYVRLIPQ
jgi:hypothetical protein